MITTNRSNLLRRCQERGYTLDEVMGCVTKQDGPLWTIDENHEAYPRENKPIQIKEEDNSTTTVVEYGVGSELKKMLSMIGITSTPNCSCNAKAKHMNDKGIDWCKDNKDLIVDWLEEEAKKRKLPFVRFAARKLINFAIYRTEKRVNG